MRNSKGSYSEAEARTVLATRLQSQRSELEEAIYLRVIESIQAAGPDDPEYQVGARLAVSMAVTFGIDVIRGGPDELPPVPVELLNQARVAARLRVPLDDVLQRCIAGRSAFDHALLGQIELDAQLRRRAIRSLSASTSPGFELLTNSVRREYAAAATQRGSTQAAARFARLQRLLNGDPTYAGDLEYDFSGRHLGAVTEGPGAQGFLRTLAQALDGQLLSTSPGGGVVWAWIRPNRDIVRSDLVTLASDSWRTTLPLGLGELQENLGGWRRTNRQARVAFAHAHGQPSQPTIYADVALAHSLSQDDLLSSSLHYLYMSPLEDLGDGGAALRETLKAYFSVDRNAVSAASALGISRHTVTKRLRQVEALLNRPLTSCATELEIALLIHEPTGSGP